MTRGKTDEDDRGQFLEWLALTPIYIGYDRYDRLNGYGYVVAVARYRQES